MPIAPPARRPVPSEPSEGTGEAPPFRPYPKLYGGGAAQVVEVEDGYKVVVVLPDAPAPPMVSPPAPPTIADIVIPVDWEGLLAVSDGKVRVYSPQSLPAAVGALERLGASGADGLVWVQPTGTFVQVVPEGSGGVSVSFKNGVLTVDASALQKRIEALEEAK